MNFPNNLHYTASHEWVRLEADGTLTLGITDAAQDMLGDIVFCGDARVGETLSAASPCAVVESVKAASDIYIPVDGEIIAFNDALDNDPSVLNGSPYDNWIVKIKPANAGADLSGLMNAEAYQKTVSA